MSAADAVEGGFAFAILLPLLFVPQLNSAGPALSFGFTLLYGAVHRREIVGILIRRWPLLLVPAYAVFSTIWSDYPSVSLKHALELLLTVTGGMLLSASRRPASVLVGAALAFGVFLASSLALGHSVMVGSMAGDTGTAFTGLNNGKNVLGMTAAVATLLSLFALLNSARTRWIIGLLGSIPMLALGLYLVFLARSAGAIIGLFLATAAFFTMACLGAIQPRGRVMACCCLLFILAAGGMLGYTFANSVTATTLELFHKDPTLTGRSYLWYRAGDFINEHPLLGRGYEAFWVQGNIDAEGLWQYAGITNRGGFNFHNTLIELLMDFGWLGTCLVILIFVLAFASLLRRGARDPSLVVSVYVAIVVFHLARTPFESLEPSAVDFATVLLIMALGYGLEKVPLSAPAAGRGVSPYAIRRLRGQPPTSARPRPRPASGLRP